MSKLKIVINIIAVLALGYLIYISHDEIQNAFFELKNVTWWLLLLQIPVQLLSYAAVAHLYYSYFHNTGNLGKLRLREMYKISLELNFVNSIFPTGGAMGFSYLGLRLRSFGINFASSTLAQSLRFVLTFISFLIILGLGLFILAINGEASNLIMLIGGSVFFMVFFGTFLFVFLINSKRRINEFVAWLPKAINMIFRTIHYKSNKELIDIAKVERVLEEIHFGYVKLRQTPGALKKPFLYALLLNFLELLTIYLVFLAFGEAVNPGAVILGYAIANFAGLVSILPGGIGAYEALMVQGLVLSGVKELLAISVTLVYRVFNLLIFIPVGLVLYQIALHRNKASFDVNKSTEPKDRLSYLRNVGNRAKVVKKASKKKKKL